MQINLLSKLTGYPGEQPIETRRLLHLFLIYRGALASVLTLFLFIDMGPSFLGSSAPDLHSVTTISYFLLTLVSLVLTRREIAPPDVEYLFAIIVDSFVIALIMHTSGGPTSGLGILLAISISLAAVGMSGRIALLAASLSSLAILAESIYALGIGFRTNPAFTQVAMLGVSYFALAILAHELYSRAQASEKLAQAQGIDIAKLTELNQYIIQQMQTGVLVLDRENRIRMMNDAARTLLGITDNSAGYTIQEASPYLANAFSSWIESPGNPRQSVHTTSEGEDIQVEFAQLGGNAQQGALIFVEDASRAAEAAQQIKLASLGRLVASIAHEIRNPLGAISHANQLLVESEQLDGPDRRMTEIIGNNAARMNDVIENILALSRRYTPQPEVLNLHQWLQGLVTELTSVNSINPEQISLQVTPGDLRLFVDRKQLAQIVSALIENAITHYSDTLSLLRLSLVAGLESNSIRPFLEISDNGTGVPQESVESIFDPFFTTKHDGTGLGLYITKMLCDANNIRISYSSAINGGSCFRLRFPRPT